MKTAIVTGATSDIGRSVAMGLTEKGYRLYLVSEGPRETLAAVAHECAGASYGVFDLAEAEASEQMVATVINQFGRLDILVTNTEARILRSFGGFSHEEFNRMVAVNVRAPFLVSQAALSPMKKNGWGRIIHIASIVAITPTREAALFGLTQAALVSLTKSMALELGETGITVNVICTGPLQTKLYGKQLSHNVDPKSIKRIPVGRAGGLEEIAAAVVYLASEEAGFVLGANLVVDGGYILDGGSTLPS